MTTLPEPPSGAIVLFCDPKTGTPEDAWIRNDAAATAGGYGDQHWYPIGRTPEDPPETWFNLTVDLYQDYKAIIVTGVAEITPGATSA